MAAIRNGVHPSNLSGGFHSKFGARTIIQRDYDLVGCESGFHQVQVFHHGSRDDDLSPDIRILDVGNVDDLRFTPHLGAPSESKQRLVFVPFVSK